MRLFAKGLFVCLVVIFSLLAASPTLQAAFELKVDLGLTDQAVPDGWLGISCDRAPDPPEGEAQTGFASVSGTAQGVTVTVSSIVEGVGYLDARSRNEVTYDNPPGDVLRDFINAIDQPLTFTLAGLAAGDYYMTTWQHDAAYGGIGRLVPTVTVTDANGTNVVATDVYDTVGYEAPFGYSLVPTYDPPSLFQDYPAEASYVISSNGTDPITIVYAGGLYQGKTTPPTVNGFIISDTIPKPGDANKDGVVDGVDAAVLATHWLAGEGVDVGGIGWREGDFNGDNMVNDIDAALMAANWTGAASAAVPEPGAAVLLISALLAVLFYKKRRD